MIVYPINWRACQDVPTYAELSEELIDVLKMIDVRGLSFSGGIDSTILLHHMDKIWKRRGKKVPCFTAALAKLPTHPDYAYAQKMVQFYDAEWHPIVLSNTMVKNRNNDLPGDAIVRAYYRRILNDGYTNIVAGDGIDEYMGGYYAHSENPTYETYQKYLAELLPNHLFPLHTNSFDVKVYLPYLAPSMIQLYESFPLSARFDSLTRKKVMVGWARHCGIPESVITRHKYGFCDVGVIKSSQETSE